jgi:hypothetical protein
MRRPFFDTMRDINNGTIVDKLDAGLNELVQAVQRTNKGGKITLTVEIAPMKDSTEAVQVKAAVSSKEPMFEDAGSIMFPTPEGNLQRNYYKQPELPGVSLVEPSREEKRA